MTKEELRELYKNCQRFGYDVREFCIVHHIVNPDGTYDIDRALDNVIIRAMGLLYEVKRLKHSEGYAV